MILIHVLDGACLGLEQVGGISDVSQELRRLQIDDAAEAGNEMQAGGRDAEKREILEIGKRLRRRMRGKITSPRQAGRCTRNTADSTCGTATCTRVPTSP